MNRDEKIVKLKLDVIFKRVFGNDNNKNIIAAFVSALLEIPRDSIKAVMINNVEVTPEYLDQKFSRLDLKLDVDGRIVNVEIQVNREPDFKERTLFYWSKIYSDELKSGEEYGDLKQTICINIINFDLFDCADYHSHFKILENERHEVLTDKLSIHFFELRKVGRTRKNKPMEDWLNLINAETEGELMDIQQTTTIPEVKDTIVMIRQMSSDEKIRQEVYYREKRLHDEATALGGARREGIAEGMEKGMKKGMAKGREEERKLLIEKLRQKGFTEDQIKDLIDE
ncbi:MAG: Rpn family recombination-promoting nuclease/putative transposase [Oscillospiraceae bacterium]|nr:Rpn family recombination-promoting nuclease/putative transposase [Oscillospiraceae bacterium]